jgi:hypothetical protein
VTDRVLIRSARKAMWAIALIMVVSSVTIHAAAGQQAQVAFRRAFVSSYVAAAIRHGRPAGPAEIEANCDYDIIAPRMTLEQLAEFSDEVHRSQPPTALAPLAPQIKRQCFHGNVGSSSMVPASSATILPNEIDGADSAAVAQAVRRLRAAEETRLMAAGGGPVMLPTGACTAIVTVSEAGHAAPGFPVACADVRLRGVMRQAVTTVAPLRAPPGSVVRLAIIANDPEPGIADTQ